MTDKNSKPTGKHTLVEEGTEFTGTLSSKCPIVVMGKVEGDVTGPVIHVTATGVVAGNVKVKELRSEGELAGQVEAEAVYIAGRVRDRTVIRARTLEVSLQSTAKGMEVVFGECELAIGDEPDKIAALAAAQAIEQTPAAAPPAAMDAARPDAAKDVAPDAAKDAADTTKDATKADVAKDAAKHDAKDAAKHDAKDAAKHDAKADAHARRRGASETWDEASAKAPEDDTRRKRGTLPPPT